MPTDASAEKRQLHQLIDDLPREQVHAALQFLNYLSADPMLVSLLNAPTDDEPYTDEQRKEDAAAESSIARGEGVPHEDILRDLGM